ncbi:hypothetical protein FBU30_000403 [Linnemannia zychae]|nr:hypothetical protein FBU30_000403 [Linnemannia zychae]
MATPADPSAGPITPSSTLLPPTSTAPPTSLPPTSTAPNPPVSPTANPNPNPNPSPDPTQTSTKPKPNRPTSTKGPVTGTATGVPPGPGNGGTIDDGSNTNKGDSGDGKKSIIAPVIGGIAGALVLAFLVAVFVMRQRKKNKARKRRLEFLDDHSAGPITSASVGRPDSLSSPHPPRPATPVNRPSGPGARPLEMAAIGGGAAAHHHQQQHQNDGYDYQQGYQQVAYGGYSDPSQQQYDQYDQQYDPYYAQRQQQQAHEYYADQQQGYYPEGHSYQQSQFTPAAPARGSLNGSPAMTQATASNMAYPPPPPSTTTGGHSSPRTTPLQQSAVPPPGQISMEKGAPYAGTQSAVRNPQIITEDDVKVPM